MAINRELQLQLLNKLSAAYPDSVRARDLADDNPSSTANLFYLQEHGLIQGSIHNPMHGSKTFGVAAITAKGLDFLEDDGGLSAILGVVTIKIHEADLLALIGARIEKSDLPEEEKKTWKDGLKKLSAESIKHLTMQLVDKGLEHLPAALDVIQTSLLHALK